MVWKRVATIGIPLAKRNSHICVSWKNKIIDIGGEDTRNYYLSDIQLPYVDVFSYRTPLMCLKDMKFGRMAKLGAREGSIMVVSRSDHFNPKYSRSH
ncbi:hypothetical protein Tco_1108086 [Tanacetum coccineum]